MGSSWARYVGSSLIAVLGRAGAGDGEVRVEHAAGPDCGTRLAKSIKLRQSSGQLKICKRIISVGFNCPSKPRDRLLVTADVKLRCAQRQSHPSIGQCVARAEAERQGVAATTPA